LDQPVAGLHEQDLEPGLGRDLDDAGAHQPASDDADVRDGHAMPRFVRDSSGDDAASSGYFRTARPGRGGGSKWVPGGHGFFTVIVTAPYRTLTSGWISLTARRGGCGSSFIALWVTA